MGMRRMGEDEARSQTFYPPWRAGQSLLHSHTPSQPIRISKTDGKSSTECLECRSVQSQALQSLLREPVHFQPATRVTFEDEERMTPTLRSRVVRVDENGPINQDQINNCEIVSRFLWLKSIYAELFSTDKLHIWCLAASSPMLSGFERSQ